MKRRAFLRGALRALVVAPIALRWPVQRAEAADDPARFPLPEIPPDALPIVTDKAIIYSLGRQRLWALAPNWTLVKTHLVSGRYGNPRPGTYYVYSKSLRTGSTKNPRIQWKYMVRFAGVPGNGIGFHQIPVRCGDDGRCIPLQKESELGRPRSAGCVRQRASDARWLYWWTPIGTPVVVVR